MRIAPWLVVLLVLPLASATWRVHGQAEPDTTWDRDGPMFADPDVSPTGARVYFNAAPNSYQTGLNPNVAATGSRLWPPHTHAWGAYLGVWKDCDRDGYVGSALGSVEAYRSELLLATDVCPDGGEHNRDGWVYELLWIGPPIDPARWSAAGVRRMVNDSDARVWGDHDVPGGAGLRGAKCEVASFDTIGEPATPPPRGTTASTGGMIGYVDCFFGHSNARAVNGIDSDGSLLLRFEDPERPERSSSVLNQRAPVNLFGDPERPGTGLYDRADGRPAFSAWDCSDPRGGLDARAPEGAPLLGTDENGTARVPVVGHPLALPAPRPEVHDPLGNYYAAVDGAERGAYGCTGGPFLYTLAYLTHPSPEVDEVPSAVEPAKRRTDYLFSFSHGAALLVASPSPGGIPLAGPALGGDAPKNAGLDAVRFILGAGPGWDALPLEPAFPQTISRADMQPEGALYATFYARVGPATLSRATLPAGDATYGAEWCADGAGVVRAFDCEPSHWWDTAYDVTVPTNPAAPRPGWSYHLRDVDCFDGTLVRGVPAQASLAGISERGTCA